jgi:hypothetical protein
MSVENKNFLNIESLYNSISVDVFPDEFENQQEIVDWIVYQLKDLLLKIRGFIFHKIKTQEIIDYFERTKAIILNELIISKKYRIKADLSEIRYLVDKIQLDCDIYLKIQKI